MASDDSRGPIIGALMAILIVGASAVTATATTRDTMRLIFEALSVVFPLSLDRAAFEDPSQRARIHDALQSLSLGADNLAAHGESLGPTHEYVRRSLVVDAHDVLDSYEQGRFDTTRFLLQEMTGACFACHSKLPAEQQFDMGARFTQEPHVRRLSLAQRARLEVATRQFESALRTYEQLFEEYPLDANRANVGLAVEEYLKIAIRVHGDFDRPIATLGQLEDRADVPPYLREEIAAWSAALRELERRERTDNLLEQARALIQEAERRADYPMDPRGLVHYMLASSLLNRYLYSEHHPAESAEAFYLLGVAESHFSSSYWLAETEFFLEQAIRLEPGTTLARRAYITLEEHVVAAYTGSTGVHVPEDVRTHLAELRALAHR
ncbi:MAG: hypothetical protein GWN84_11700 [Gammaproteobacteria bacterium]|nr:hypothetical protein [Gammaproteobacteria bacterium]NIR83531.1 hypothetical protein [Gammaproteobacteria bacterium]NIR91453.1 hypothetical protein [Gammaproteobacteria bacterium]NIU04693.1 hypothetical protein [Gammaproteobacteria bacterium]NIV51735.1 hypothetical protein [Gammaproteobacteria bacterium]